MSIRWWESYIRTGLCIATVGGLIIGWGFPVSFTGILSQVDVLAKQASWLHWLTALPQWLKGIIQGVLPQILLAILMALLPVTLRFIAKQSGAKTGMQVELTVQNYYFVFLFVQVFLVVSIASGFSTIAKDLAKSVSSAPSLLASNLPRASNYFFSLMLLQAFSVSAGALVQISGLVTWFILAPLLDNTARQKWSRQTNLPQVKWGTFFPVYTNLASIGKTRYILHWHATILTTAGLIYSVISPLIL